MSTSGRDDGDSISGILLDQADRLFKQHATRAVLAEAERGGWPEALWAAVEEAGLTLARVPEEAGGVGLGPGDAALLVRHSAFHAVPIPLAETILANALWSRAGGTPVEGPVTLAPAARTDGLRLSGPPGGARLSGRAVRVPWGAQAGHVLAVARDADGVAHLCLVPAGSGQVSPARNVAYEPRDTISFEGTALPPEAVLAVADTLAGSLWPEGAALRSLQMAGAMERCLDHALTYANERVQFGRPIAKFQAIQHMLAVAAGHLAAASAAADALAEADGTAGFELACAIAKARTGEAAGQVAAICHQVHGAMGFTQEHPLHFATRRLWSWRDEFGSETAWQGRIGRLVCGLGGEALWPLVTGERPPAPAARPSVAAGAVAQG